MANRFAGLTVEDDDEPVAVAPAQTKAAPAAAAAAPKAAAQRAPRPTKADTDAGFRQQGQVSRPSGERAPRSDRPRTERAPRDPNAPREERPRQPRAPRATDGEELPERKVRDPGHRHGEFKGPGRVSQALRGKREYDRQGAVRKETEKSTNMGLGKAEKTDDSEPATVGELKVEAAEAAVNAEAENPKVEDEEDAKLKTLEQYKASVQKKTFELPAARVANEGQDAFKNQELVTREDDEELFARKESSKKTAAPKERKVVQTIAVEPKSLLDSRRSEAPRDRDAGRGATRGGRGGRAGSAPTPARAPRAAGAAAPNLNDQTAFPSLK